MLNNLSFSLNFGTTLIIQSAGKGRGIHFCFEDVIEKSTASNNFLASKKLLLTKGKMNLV